MTLNEKITASEKRIASIKERQAELAERLRKEEAELEHLRMMDNSEKFSALEALTGGMTFEELKRILEEHAGNRDRDKEEGEEPEGSPEPEKFNEPEEEPEEFNEPEEEPRGFGFGNRGF